MLKSIQYFVNKITRKRNYIVLIPHSGIYLGNKGSLENFASDNVLTFANYLFKNTTPGEYKFFLATGGNDIIEKEKNICNSKYPDQDIVPFNYFEYPSLSFLDKIKQRVFVFSLFTKTKYFFIAAPRGFHYKVDSQKIICLSYYSTPFKNDYFEPKKGDIVTLDYRAISKGVDLFVTNSLLSSQINSIAMGMKITNFQALGMCRNDNFNIACDPLIRKSFLSRVSYDVKKIILYTPTHRDYEQSEFDITRSILGFDVIKKDFSSFLISNNLLLICKLHPRQNKLIVTSDLPEGVINFIGSEEFGLTELMQISDMMITDYTSAYFDYILLNKPILFNFYDYEKYEQIRGFSFDPLAPFLAGEIFNDEKSFYESIMNAINNDQYEEKRVLISSIVNKWKSDSCERIYNYFKNQIC